MRELKFRLYSKPAKKYIDYIMIGFSKTGELRSYSTENGYGPVLEDNYVVEQYTGLKDKNDKEIYEGDILRFKGGSKSIVKFCEMKDSDCTYFYLGWASVQDDNEPMSLCEEAGFCEVIGNIHENPELLEGEL